MIKFLLVVVLSTGAPVKVDHFESKKECVQAAQIVARNYHAATEGEHHVVGFTCIDQYEV